MDSFSSLSQSRGHVDTEARGGGRSRVDFAALFRHVMTLNARSNPYHGAAA